MDSQKFCLKWDGFQGSVTSVFDQLRSGGELLDVTLCCEGQRVRAHRMMLSACSPYFRELLKSISCQQMVIFLKDTTAADLSAIVEFIYKGSVNVSQSQLASFIKTAEMLQIRGLSGEEDKPPDPAPAPPSRPAPPRHHPLPPRLATPPPKRRRTSDSGDAPLSSGPAPAWPRPAASPARRPETPVVLSGSSNQSIPSPSPVAMSPAAASATAASAAALGSAETGGGAEGAPSLPASSSTTPSATSGSTFTSSSAAPSSSFSPSVGGSSVPTARSRETLAKHESENIKVEKVDLSDGEDGGSLDAALGQLNEYEGYVGAASSAQGVSFAAGHQYGPLPTGLPGASHHPPHGAPMEDGSAPDSRPMFVCKECGRRYSNRQALTHHLKVHQGLTTCRLCGKVLCIVSHLRRHLAQAHNLGPEQIRLLAPTAIHGRYQGMHDQGWMASAAQGAGQGTAQDWQERAEENAGQGSLQD
ncbi:broad-complex core protein isoforms 1/2/3/4/5-like isoform X3 [Amphibalanus amphitrite]|nr:broad-complex core protein isoforms 1/2/3/4/5-like isoform X3 [Amphibalanus amphitrite]XP_043225120.1 broad-complex core protein isoforms 1/2/3/4/5-like isoform X3 [Amphibalanus amphitrite]XP_043225121.1 broad-complex core protein isoforms 1/2/3/4/5-like isoform X3 [Amphibalanus amphitrite]XP_043225122.1 broad-complex core protein isoforms 1/2/3/4/5-like isoform X3 [Amphibalanus amphitrite]